MPPKPLSLADLKDAAKRVVPCEKLYNQKAWKRFAKQVRRTRIYCEDCGQIARRMDVHHIQKVADRPDLMMEQSNVMLLCISCHARRTQRGE